MIHLISGFLLIVLDKGSTLKIEAGGAGVFAKAVSTDSTVDVTAQNVTGNNEYGIYAAVEKGGSAEVTAETIKSENSTGVVFTADNNEKSNIKIKTGSIESDSDGIYGSAGLASDETGGSSVTVETGSITSENGTIYIAAFGPNNEFLDSEDLPVTVVIPGGGSSGQFSCPSAC